MKKKWVKTRRGEKGYVLIVTMLLLLVASLIIAPLLGFMGTGLLAGEVFETKTEEVYAADAGIEDAIWKINNGFADTMDPNNPDLRYAEYDLDDAVNGRSVHVTIECHRPISSGSAIFKVTSEARDAPEEPALVTVVSWVAGVVTDYSDILENTITSLHDVDLPPHPEGIDEPIVEDYPGPWPTAEILADWYIQDVEPGDPYPDGTIDPKDTHSAGPLYRNGDLEIRSTQNDSLLTLNGTIYVKGNLSTANNKTFTLDLNENVIFVEGSIDMNTKCTITGSGAIIAIGDINFAPNIESGEGDFLFVMSVEGTTTFQPNGDYSGSVAGNLEVQLQPGVTVTHIDPPDEFNFPSLDPEKQKYDVYSYKITP